MKNQNASPAIPNLSIDSLSLVKGQGKLYQNRDWLYQKYWKEELSIKKIAKLIKVSYGTIRNHMCKFRIKRRSLSESRKGKNNYNYGRHFSKKIRKKISETRIKKGLAKGEKNYFYGIHLIGKKNGNWKGGKIKRICKICGATFEVKLSVVKKDCGITCSKICHYKLRSERFKGKNNPNWKKHPSKEIREKISKSHMGFKYSEETKRKHSKLLKRNWQNPEFIKKILKSQRKKPTNPEKIFNELTPNIIRYVGNRAWWKKLDDGKYHNPDFKVTGQNKVIEIFGDYWHNKKSFPEILSPQELIDLYKQMGLDCLIFWEHEIYNNQEEILEQVNQFINI